MCVYLNKDLYSRIVLLYKSLIWTRINRVERIRISYFLALSRVARFYATTEQKWIHSFCNALRIRRKINQLHQSSCYAWSIYYTTQNNLWICRYRFNGKVFLDFFCITPRTCKIKKSTVNKATNHAKFCSIYRIH